MADHECDLQLAGCTSEPLMAYLKALGVLRLVSEQSDPNARGWWRHNTFWLRSRVLFDGSAGQANSDSLLAFFLVTYEPSPIVVPWTGKDFFDANPDGNPGPFSRTPTGSKIIEAYLASSTDRLRRYRGVIRATMEAMTKCAVERKEDIDTQKGKVARARKAAFFAYLRQVLDDKVLGWIDAAGICTDDLRFSALLGSGGGSDGNTHFSDNFMQNVWDVLPDFDSQRRARKKQSVADTAEGSRRFLRGALFDDEPVQLMSNRTSSLFDSGAVGGPNATQGMERDALSNPWNVILAMEGSLAFAGAATKRLGEIVPSEAAFPFQVSAVATKNNSLVDKERSGSEIWLPLWNRPAQATEVLTLLREGRAQCGTRRARSGTDMARAAAGLGVDRGIEAFFRYAIVKGRVGGENYHTAASLGRFEVRDQEAAHLLRDVDPWLDKFRAAAESPKSAPRFTRALRAIDSAIVNYCRYGSRRLFEDILVALGRAERELALTPGKVGQSKWPPGPLVGLSRNWIKAADDQSAEFTIACALAGIYDPHQKVGPLRVNLEPLDWSKRFGGWAEKYRSVVWNAGDLPRNLCVVLERRMMDGERLGCENLPYASSAKAPLSAIGGFIAGETHDARIEDLLWGLMLVEPHPHRVPESPDDPGIATAYALLKLLFLPRPLVIHRHQDGSVRCRYARRDENGIRIRPEPRVTRLLRAGRLGEACGIAMRRLRASGLTPMPQARGGRTRDGDWRELDQMGHALDPIRLAAALLIPISGRAVSRLITLVSRPGEINSDPAGQTVAALTKGD